MPDDAAKKAPTTRKRTAKAATSSPPRPQGDADPMQLRTLAILQHQFQLTDRDEALAYCSRYIGRPIESRTELSKDEARDIIQSFQYSRPSDYLPDVHSALVSALRDIPAIEKGRRNEEHNYSFRGIEQLINGVSPVLAKHGIHWTVRVLSCVLGERPTRSGGTQMTALMTTRYRIYGPAGDRLTTITTGLGMDTSDKAVSKAATACFKMLIQQTLNIPFQHDDQDATSPEGEGPPPLPKLSAADQVKTDSLLQELTFLAGMHDTDLEGITRRFRETYGGQPVEALSSAPPDLLEKFTASVRAWTEQQDALAEQAQADAEKVAQAAAGTAPAKTTETGEGQ